MYLEAWDAHVVSETVMGAIFAWNLPLLNRHPFPKSTPRCLVSGIMFWVYMCATRLSWSRWLLNRLPFRGSLRVLSACWRAQMKPGRILFFSQSGLRFGEKEREIWKKAGDPDQFAFQRDRYRMIQEGSGGRVFLLEVDAPAKYDMFQSLLISIERLSFVATPWHEPDIARAE